MVRLVERVSLGDRVGRASADDSDATPSFALMDVQGPVIVTYVYQLVEGEVSEAVPTVHSRI